MHQKCFKKNYDISLARPREQETFLCLPPERTVITGLPAWEIMLPPEARDETTDTGLFPEEKNQGKNTINLNEKNHIIKFIIIGIRSIDLAYLIA